MTGEETKQEKKQKITQTADLQMIRQLTGVFLVGTGPARGTTSYQHVCGIEVVLAGHALFQLLRHLLDVLYLIQQIQDMFVLNPFNPQLAQLIPFAMQQHLA